MARKEFIVRQMNGIMRGKLELDTESTRKYNEATPDGQADYRIGLSVQASQRINTECYVNEVL